MRNNNGPASSLDELLDKKEYVGPSRYYSGRIIEYDIKSANINILYHEGVLNEEKYNYYSKLPKDAREVAIGQLMQRDNTIYHVLMNGILKFRRMIVESNNIKEEEIIRLATDAIYVNRFTDLAYTKFDNIEFVKKSESSNMVRLLDLLIFSKYIDNNIDIDVKGLGNSTYLHQNFMLSIIANVIYMLERVSLEDAISYLTQMYEQYVRLQLPTGFYRQLNPYSGYLIKGLNMIIYDETDISMIDINYNLQYLRELHNILFERFH